MVPPWCTLLPRIHRSSIRCLGPRLLQQSNFQSYGSFHLWREQEAGFLQDFGTERLARITSALKFFHLDGSAFGPKRFKKKSGLGRARRQGGHTLLLFLLSRNGYVCLFSSDVPSFLFCRKVEPSPSVTLNFSELRLSVRVEPVNASPHDFLPQPGQLSEFRIYPSKMSFSAPWPLHGSPLTTAFPLSLTVPGLFSVKTTRPISNVESRTSPLPCPPSLLFFLFQAEVSRP